MRKIVLFALVVVSAYMSVVVAQNDEWIACPDLEAAEPLWLNTSSQRTGFRGWSMQVYAIKPNNETYEDEWVQLGLVRVREYRGSFGCGSDLERPEDDAYPTFAPQEDALCYRTQGVRLLAPQVEERYISVNMTWALSSLSLFMTLSLTNVTYTINVPASDNTLDTSFAMEYNSIRPKLSVEMQDFPWKPSEFRSSLNFGFLATLHVIGDALVKSYSDERRIFMNLEAELEKATFKLEYLRAFEADGEHYAISLSEENRNYTLNMTHHHLPFFIGMCINDMVISNYRYNKLVYDPSIIALYTGDPDPSSPPSSSTSPSKRRLHPAAYAVPIAVVVTAIIVFVALVVFVPAIGKPLAPALHPPEFKRPPSI